MEEEYTVEVEISFENISFLESVKAHLNSLSFPIQGNGTDPATDIMSIAMTTGEQTHIAWEQMAGYIVRKADCCPLNQIKHGTSWPPTSKNQLASSKFPSQSSPYFKWWPEISLVVAIKWPPRYRQTLPDKLLNPFPLKNVWVQQGGSQYVISSDFFSLGYHRSGNRSQAHTWIRSKTLSKIVPGHDLTLCLMTFYWNETVLHLSQGTIPKEPVSHRWGCHMSYNSSVLWKAPL